MRHKPPRNPFRKSCRNTNTLNSPFSTIHTESLAFSSVIPSATMFHQTVLLALAFLSVVSFAQVSENFDSGWNQTAWPIYAPDCNQGGKVTLDSTTAHSGKNSIRVDGAGGYCGHIFFGTTKVPSGDVYVRTWLYVPVPLFAELE